MKHLKEKSNKIINAIPEGYLPTASDNRLVNTYFYVHFICNSGSRPSAFARMRLKEIKNAKKRPQLTNDKGDSYRYLSTTDHKTGDSYIARVNFYEEDWQILYKYYKYMRPKAYDDKNDKYLFLNSNGKLLTSPPADLIDILKQEGIPHFTATDARHALTTLSRDHLSPEEQRFIDFLLCHSTSTSDKHYVDDTRNKFPKAVDKVKFLYDVALSDKPAYLIQRKIIRCHKVQNSLLVMKTLYPVLQGALTKPQTCQIKLNLQAQLHQVILQLIP